MVSKGEEDNMAIIKEFMRFKVHMEGSVNGHEFEIEGEGEGRPYEGTQTAKLKVTKGGPCPSPGTSCPLSSCTAPRPT